MEYIHREDMQVAALPGRGLQRAVGKNSVITSERMSVGFARYDTRFGPMEPHHHAEETVLILDAENGWVRYGKEKDQLGERIELKKGMILHFPELEWHVFEYDTNGFVDIAFIYGQVDRIRPEEIAQ